MHIFNPDYSEVWKKGNVELRSQAIITRKPNVSCIRCSAELVEGMMRY
jgi:hypothetical protein